MVFFVWYILSIAMIVSTVSELINTTSVRPKLIYTLGAVHKLRHPIRGYGGVSQKMTKDDIGEGGGLAKDDRYR